MLAARTSGGAPAAQTQQRCSRCSCSQRLTVVAQQQPHQQQQHGRRLLLAGVAAASLAAASRPAVARSEPVNREADAAQSPYIQELLRRSEEKREERTKERLDNYYKRVFADYFAFDAGSPRAAAARGISPETQAKIAQWLKDNQ